MKLRRIRIGRMPGIDQPFELTDLDGGLNLISGPNGSGKSTICRAVRALLWPDIERPEAVSLAAEWEDGGERLHVEREHDRTRWRRDGADADAPPVPDSALARCFNLGVSELLLDAGATDRQVALEILRQMSGGYDLREVRRRLFTTKPNAGKKEEARVKELEIERRRLRLAQELLAEREERRQGLEAELAAARRAGDELKLAQAAGEVAEARRRLEGVESDLAAFPAGMDRLTGDEPGRLDESAADLERAKSDLATCREAQRAAARTIADCRLPGGLLDEHELGEWSTHARSLRVVEEKSAGAGRALASALAERESTAAALDPEDAAERKVRPSGEQLESLDGFLRRATELQARAAKLRAAEDDGGAAEDAPSRRDVDEGRERLAGWLAADAARRRAGLIWLWVVALLAAAAGVAAALTHHPAWWLLAAAGAGWLLLLVWLQLAAAGAISPAVYRRAFERLPLEPPESWDATAVRGALRRLDADLAGIELRERKRVLAEEDERKRRDLEQDLAAHEEQRASLRSALGIDPGRPDLELVVLARRVEAHRAAEQKHDAARIDASALREEWDSLLERLNDFLGGHGEAPCADAAAVEAGLDRLKERSRKLQGAMRGRDDAARQEAQLSEQIGTLESRIAEVFRKAGLEPGARDELDERLKARGDFTDLAGKARTQRALIAEKEPLLAGAEDLLALSPDEAQARIDAVKERAEKTEALVAEITSIGDAVAAAREGDARERLRARRDDVLEALVQRREERLAATAGSVLLDEIGAEYDRASRPEVLRRAIDYFALFTGNGYTLKLTDAGETPDFQAVEARSGRHKRLAELSDGTRIQLLLAARLAFASGLDRGRRIPLFLDEVLTTSDPVRFDAVARSVAAAVEEEGRQVFYLTANPSDTARWNRLLEGQGKGPLHAVDLAEVRGLAAAATSAAELVADPRPEPPAPDGLAAAEYGKLLRVPPMNVDLPRESLHLFHLLNDDLPLLHRLVVAGIETAGQWDLVNDRGGSAEIFGEGTAAHLNALVDLYGVFHQARRIGRGRPVDREALCRSGQVSDSFIDRVESLAADLQGDARRLLAALRSREDERAKRFHASAAGQLRDWLRSEGYLDEREPLTMNEINARVLTALAGEVESKRLTDAEIARRVHALFELSGK